MSMCTYTHPIHVLGLLLLQCAFNVWCLYRAAYSQRTQIINHYRVLKTVFKHYFGTITRTYLYVCRFLRFLWLSSHLPKQNTTNVWGKVGLSSHLKLYFCFHKNRKSKQRKIVFHLKKNCIQSYHWHSLDCALFHFFVVQNSVQSSDCWMMKRKIFIAPKIIDKNRNITLVLTQRMHRMKKKHTHTEWCYKIRKDHVVYTKWHFW